MFFKIKTLFAAAALPLLVAADTTSTVVRPEAQTTSLLSAYLQQKQQNEKVVGGDASRREQNPPPRPPPGCVATDQTNQEADCEACHYGKIKGFEQNKICCPDLWANWYCCPDYHACPFGPKDSFAEAKKKTEALAGAVDEPSVFV